MNIEINNVKDIAVVGYLIRKNYSDYDNLVITESENVLSIKFGDITDRYEYYKDWEIDEIIDAYNEDNANQFIENIDDYDVRNYVDWKKWHHDNDVTDILDINPDLEYYCELNINREETYHIYKYE